MHKSYHFIAIGGAVMHQLAIYLHQQGNSISGSDDMIFDPAKTNLEKKGLLPLELGWNINRIHNQLDGIILGMHAKKDNPELVKAQQLGLKIYSFPEFIYQHSQTKKRLVVAGSHGKTTITSIIMHILKACNIDFDYLVGSKIKDFDTMVRISNAPIIVIEGDEYLSSPIDLRSKFLHYKPDIAIISGIAWDHINVFPTFENYLSTFSKFITSISEKGWLIYYEQDNNLQKLVHKAACQLNAYKALKYDYNVAGGTNISYQGQQYGVQIFGQHNMENINAAVLACNQLGIPIKVGLQKLSTFEGAAKRMENIFSNHQKGIFIYRDFAHAPSKLIATLKALKEKYKAFQIIAIFELHTFSSLQEDFLSHYKDCLKPACESAVFLDNHALKTKGNVDFKDKTIQEAFNDNRLTVIRDNNNLKTFLNDQSNENVVFAFMSSGNFGGFDISTWQHIKFVNK